MFSIKLVWELIIFYGQWYLQTAVFMLKLNQNNFCWLFRFFLQGIKPVQKTNICKTYLVIYYSFICGNPLWINSLKTAKFSQKIKSTFQCTYFGQYIVIGCLLEANVTFTTQYALRSVLRSVLRNNKLNKAFFIDWTKTIVFWEYFDWMKFHLLNVNTFYVAKFSFCFFITAFCKSMVSLPLHSS